MSALRVQQTGQAAREGHLVRPEEIKNAEVRGQLIGKSALGFLHSACIEGYLLQQRCGLFLQMNFSLLPEFEDLNFRIGRVMINGSSSAQSQLIFSHGCVIGCRRQASC